MALSYAQTFLITDAIVYLETPAQFRDVRRAYGLVGAAAIIYTGTAVCRFEQGLPLKLTSPDTEYKLHVQSLSNEYDVQRSCGFHDLWQSPRGGF
jgi:hypothetical protein